MTDKIALFDFDGTLTRHDSFLTFGRFAAGTRRLLIAAVRSLPHIIGWKLRIIPGGKAKETLFGHLYRGWPQREWQEKCRAFAAKIDTDLRDDIVRKLRQHQQQGHSTVIVTASPADWVKPWALGAGIDKVIGTEVEIGPDGCLTGRFATPNCHGAEKVTRTLSAIPGLRECETWGYGDSLSDTPLLSLTTHPLIV